MGGRISWRSRKSHMPVAEPCPRPASHARKASASKIIAKRIPMCEVVGRKSRRSQKPHACCTAMSATCLACTEGISVEEYCKKNTDVRGCGTDKPEKPEKPHACCTTISATCLACTEGISVEEYCKKNTDVPGCGTEKPEKPEKPDACCTAM